MGKYRKRDVGKLLADVPAEYVFRCHDGSVFRSMRDLRDGLEGISEDIFLFHANAGRNDFGNWVSNVIDDPELTRDLSNAASRIEAAKCVASRVSFLSGKLESDAA
ncbi:MAG: hypothetical protein ACLFVA_05815 [Dehalococcoidia bacterium]